MEQTKEVKKKYKNMIKNEVIVTEVDGTKKIFNSVSQAGEYYGITSTAITNRILGKVKSDPRKFEYTGKKSVAEKRKNRQIKDKDDDTPLKSSRKQVPYETLGTRVCITLCQHRKDVKVGSMLCQGCLRFHGINRDKHIVICG